MYKIMGSYMAEIHPFVLILAQAFWLIAPAYAANAFPPLLRGKKPIDSGKSIGKNRILGDGKTIEGAIGGILFGAFIGSVQVFGQDYIPAELGLNLIKMTLPLAILLGVGAILGDIVGSFLKRRLGIQSGKPFFPVDQLDFLLLALLFAAFLTSISIWIVAVLIILTPIVHKIANIIGYLAGVKKNPW